MSANGDGGAERVFLALGANLGDRAENLDRALAALERRGVRVVARSRWIETEPEGGADEPGYLNGVAEVRTELAPRALLDALLEIEREQGRQRVPGAHSGPRPLDLDLLLYGARAVDEPGLRVPHPRMERRAFVLAPLAEVAPDLVLSGGRTVRERLEQVVREQVTHRTGAPNGRPAPMDRLTDPRQAAEWCAAARGRGASIGFVPTMGALHDGHLTLVERSIAENDATCVSVFVNPLQFNDPKDLAAYPRDFDGDCARLEQVGCTMVFTGTLEGFFPGELDAAGGLPAEHLVDPGPAACGLEGEFRPGHFAGVATIVRRLFEVVRPDRAYFGQKDFQQCLVVDHLARAMGGPDVVVCPTSRESSGLARSSRNLLLQPEEAARAACLYRALNAARDAWRAGERDAGVLADVMRERLAGEEIELEYAEVRDPSRWTGEEPREALADAVALIAAKVGGVRLIDNLVLSS